MQRRVFVWSSPRTGFQLYWQALAGRPSEVTSINSELTQYAVALGGVKSEGGHIEANESNGGDGTSPESLLLLSREIHSANLRTVIPVSTRIIETNSSNSLLRLPLRISHNRNQFSNLLASAGTFFRRRGGSDSDGRRRAKPGRFKICQRRAVSEKTRGQAWHPANQYRPRPSKN